MTATSGVPAHAARGGLLAFGSDPGRTAEHEDCFRLTMLRLCLAAFAVVVSTMYVSACSDGESNEKRCTLLEGSDSVTLTFTGGADGDEYLVYVDSDLVQAKCPMTLGSSVQPKCETVRGEARAAVGRDGVRVDAAPAELTVRLVAADGTTLLEEIRRPAYRDDYPNGPQCDSVPYQVAEETFAIPPHQHQPTDAGTDADVPDASADAEAPDAGGDAEAPVDGGADADS